MILLIETYIFRIYDDVRVVQVQIVQYNNVIGAIGYGLLCWPIFHYRIGDWQVWFTFRAIL